MNTLCAEPEDVIGAGAGAPTLEPFVLDGCAAFLHLPPAAGPFLSRGIVLCSALGYDERCLRRPMRLLAETLARRGAPTLRFDLPGQGDSLELPLDADAPAAWIAATRRAGAWLRSELGLSSVVFGGFRLGALLAAEAAHDADRLMLLAPVASGKSWLSRVRFAAAQGAAREEGPGARRGLDADGVLLGETSCRSLATLGLAGEAPLPPTLLLASGRPPAALSAALARRRPGFEQAPFPGFERLLIGASDNEIDAAVLESASAFALEGAGDGVRRPVPPAGLPRSLEGPGWCEALIAPAEGICAALTRPAQLSASGPGVIFLNAGGDPKAGVGRFAAAAARSLAAEGVACLRLDFRGVADSPEPEGVTRTHPYLTPRREEIAAAAAALRAAGASEIFLVGISAGGYQALRGVIENPDLAGAFCISTLKFVWRPGDGVVIGSKRWGRPARAYARDLLRPTSWRRLLAGEVRVGWILRSLLARVLSLAQTERRTPESRALVKAVEALSERGRRVTFFMGTEDAALEEVEAHFGPGGGRFSALGGMTVEVRPELDHGLVYARSRAIALGALRRFLGLPGSERRAA